MSRVNNILTFIISHKFNYKKITYYRQSLFVNNY